LILTGSKKGKWRNCVVAIKRMHFAGDNEKKLAEFRDEAMIMMALRPHRNVVQVPNLV
jgi:hypothetical protein